MVNARVAVGRFVSSARIGAPVSGTLVWLGRLARSGALAALGGLALSAAVEGQTIPTVNVSADDVSVEEGTAASFTLTRTAPLDAALTVNLNVSATRLTTFSSVLGAKTATFAAGAETVAYSVSTFNNLEYQEDPDSDPSQSVTLVVTASTDSSYALGDDDAAAIRVTDNDEIVEFSIVVPNGGFRLAEAGGSISFSVTATTLTGGSPTDNSYRIGALTDVHGSAYSPYDYGAISTFVSFSAAGWTSFLVDEKTRYTNSASVTLNIYDDEIAEGDETFDLVLRPFPGQGVPPYGTGTAVVTILDDDTAGVTVSPTSLTVVEDSTQTYTVVLTSQPEFDDVTVIVSAPSGTDVSVNSPLLTFTPDDWDVSQTVTVRAADDDDAVVDAETEISHSATGGGYEPVTIDSVTVAIMENDTAGVAVSPTALSVTENSSGAYAVSLKSRPTADVAVTVSVPAGTDVSVDKTSLTFTPQNWATEQMVTVTAADDSDATVDAAVTISHSAAGGGYDSLPAASVTVTIKENDIAGVTVTPTALAVTEGSNKAYTIELTSAPSADVAVTVSVPSGTDVSVDKTSLTFTPLNWSTKQTVTVAVASDDDAVVESAVTIGHSASGGGYGTVSVDSVTVTTTETDTAGVTLSATALTVTEGAMDRYTVRLTSAPTANVVVTVAPPTGVSVSDTSLTFTSTNWATAQTVTVTAADDDDATMGAAVSITHSAAGGGYDSVTVASVRVTIRENDVPGVSVSPTRLDVVEGSEEAYLVRLRSRPTASVSVGVSAPSGTDVSVDTTTLTFTVDNWSTRQEVTVTAAQDTDHAADSAVTIAHTASGGDYNNVSVPSVVVQVVDDDREVSVTADRSTVAEGGSATFTVSLAGGNALAPVTVTYDVGGTATSGDDYTAPSGRVRFATGEARKTLTIATRSDDALESDETLVVTLTGATAVKGMATVSTTAATTTIEDDDELTVALAGPGAVAEGSSATYTVSVTGATSTAAVVVAYSVEGTATSGADYTAPTGTLTIASGATSGTFRIETESDDVLDRDETMIVTLTSASTTQGSAELSATAKAVTTTITDSGMVTVSVAAAKASEGSAVAFPVTLSGEVSSDVALSWSTAAGTATSGTDYTAVSSGTLTVAAGDTSGTLTVSTTEDTLTEADETLTVTMTGPSLPTGVSLAVATATGTIEDDDDLTATVSGPTTVTEGSSASYTVTLSGGTSTAAVVTTYSVRGTATSGTDYTAPPGTLTIAAGAPSGTFTIATESDDVLDRGETMIVTLSGVSTATGSGEVSQTAGSVTTTITDSGTATVSVAAAEASEGGALSFPVTLSGKVSSDVVLGWSTTAGTATSGTDYTAESSGTLTVAAGDTSGTLTVSTTEDMLTEADETLTVTITGTTLPSGVSLATNGATATGTIEDDDPLTVSVAANPLSVTEGGSATFQVTLAGGTSTANVVVTYSLDGSTATSGSDYTDPTDKTLTIASGTASGTITIVTLTDTVLEAGEKLQVTLSGATTTGSVAISGTAGSATAAITDTGMVTASVGPASEAEGDSLTFTVSLSGQVASSVELAWSTSAGTAESGTDFTAVTSGAITFQANDTSETVTVSTTEDVLTEADETLTVTITGTTLPSGVSLGVDEATGTIEDDDDLTAAVATAATVAEGDPAIFTVTLTGGTSTADVVVEYSVGGTATSGTDYTAPSNKTLTIGAGASSGTISIATTADDVLDRGEELSVELDTVTTENGSAEVSGTSGSATTTIADSGTVTASVGPPQGGGMPGGGGSGTAMEVVATEGEDLDFQVSLTGKVSSDVVLSWSTSAGTATSGSDFAAVSAGSLTIAAGETSGTFSVSTVEDGLTEAGETLNVTISGATLPDGVSLGNSMVSATIRDDDPLTASVTADELAVAEGSPASFTVSLTGGTSTANVVVRYSVEGEAVAGDDYTAPSGTLTIGRAATSGMITIVTLEDEVLEPGETLEVVLDVASTTGTAEVSETAGSATAAITDPGMVTVSVGPARASEGNAVEFPVSLSGKVSSDVEVAFSTWEGTAASAADYAEMMAEVVTIPAGDTAAILSVSTADDVLAEGVEAFEVTISTPTLPSGVSVGVAKAIGTIEDDDELLASVAATPPSLSEGQPARFTVSLSGGTSTAEAVVSYSVEGSATAGLDYVAPAGSLTLGAGIGSGTIEIATLRDDLLEPEETLIVTLAEITGAKGMATVDATPATATITHGSGGSGAGSDQILLSASPSTVAEDGGGQTIEVTATLGGERRLTAVAVTVTVAGGTATKHLDFKPVKRFDVTIPAEARSGRTSFSLTPVADSKREPRETVVLSGVPNALDLQATVVEITIVDSSPDPDPDADLPAVSIASGPSPVVEGAPVEFTVTRSQASPELSAVGVAISETGSVLTGAPPAEVRFAPGETTALLRLATVDDQVTEPDSEVRATLAADAAYELGTPASAVVTVADNDATVPREIVLTLDPERVSEADGPTVVSVTATLSGGVRNAETVVEVEVGGSGGDGAVDFSPVDPFEIVVSAGEVSGSAGFTLTPENDKIRERDESIELSGTSTLPVTPAFLLLEDDDESSGAIQLSVTPEVVAEGGGPVEVEVTASLDVSARSVDTPVVIALSGSGEARAVDYQAVDTFELMIPKGELSGSVTFSVAPEDDRVDELDETIHVSGTSALPVTSASLVLEDDDEPSRSIAVAVTPEVVAEGGGTVEVEVTASLDLSARSVDTPVVIALSGSGEARAVDYQAVDTLELMIPSGELSGSVTFSLTPEDDRVDELDETIHVSGTSVLPVTPASLVLEDDDEPSRSIAVTVTPEIVAEGGGPVMVEVTASLDVSARSVDTPVVIAVSGSGEAGAVDYRAVDTFELTIPSGELSGTASFSLTPEDDRVDEFNETIHVSGSSVLPVTSASLLLEDDDEPSEAIQLSVAPQVVMEDGGGTLVTVMASLDQSARVEGTDVRIQVDGSGRTGVVGFEPVEAFELTIPAEEISGFGAFVLIPVNDMEEASSEAIEVRGEADLPVGSAQVSLLDDDDASHARAWLSRFARTVASQTVETVEERLLGRSGGANHLTLAGQRILAGRGPQRRAGARLPTAAFGGGAWFAGPPPGAPLSAGPLPVGASSGGGWPTGQGPFGSAGYGAGPTLMGGMSGGNSLGAGRQGSLASGPFGGWDGRRRSFSLGRYRADQRWDLLARSSFSLSSAVVAAEDEDGAAATNWTAWGRGALTNFQGTEGELSLRGDVVTGTVGVDVERGRFLSGFAVGFSRGDGGFGSGPEAEASLTSGHPYLRMQVNEKLALWGVLGYGRGEFSLTEEGSRTKETDIALAMGAVGLRRDLVSSARGFGLGLLSDVLLARIESDPVPGLAEVGEEVNRLRLAVEGSYDRMLAGGGALTPTLELGLRYDGGDADTGFGVEMGAGLRYADIERGLRIEFTGRSLLTHQASGFEEWGGAGSMTLDPGESGRGLALGLRSSWGAAHGGVQQFWSQQQMFDPVRGGGLVQGGRVEAEAGYGLGRAGGRSLVGPYGVVMLSEEGERGTGVGIRFDFARLLSVRLEVSRRLLFGAEPEDAVVLRGTFRRDPNVP